MKFGKLLRSLGSGPDDSVFLGTRRADVITGSEGDDIIIGGRGPDVLTGGGGADVFAFDDRHAGDVSWERADRITDFGPDDIIDLTATAIVGYGERAGLRVWQAVGNTYITWNTYGAFHDIELTGYTGDVHQISNQIRWYEDDHMAGVGTQSSVVPGAPATGVIEDESDEDWFRIDLEAGQAYTFAASGADGGGGTLPRPLVFLYDENGEYVDSGYETLVYAPDAGGTYFIAVDGNWTVGSYRLDVTARPTGKITRARRKPRGRSSPASCLPGRWRSTGRPEPTMWQPTPRMATSARTRFRPPLRIMSTTMDPRRPLPAQSQSAKP